MNSLRMIKNFSLAGTVAVMMAPALSAAEVSRDVATSDNGHSVVQRVSYSLAESESYSRPGNVGYKWGKTAEIGDSISQWETGPTDKDGYKWDRTSSNHNPTSRSFAGSTAYKWGSMSFSEQSAYRWGVRSFSDQSAYRWGVRNNSDQAAYRWGVRSVADQAAYRWGVRSVADQAAYRWGVRSVADQTAYRWGVR
jgi:hypothetical protein